MVLQICNITDTAFVMYNYYNICCTIVATFVIYINDCNICHITKSKGREEARLEADEYQQARRNLKRPSEKANDADGWSCAAK